MYGHIEKGSYSVAFPVTAQYSKSLNCQVVVGELTEATL